MGLTIHFRLHSDAASPADARRLVERLRQRALDLPLTKVGKIVERVGADCDITNCRLADRPLLGTAVQFLIDGETGHPVEPTHVIGFSTLPGDGCEFAHFGLARYPATIKVEGLDRPTGLSGWNWTAHVKTQYASNPSLGDTKNFLACHLAVIPADSIIVKNVWRDFGYICKRASVQRYAKPIHTLRKSGITDWSARFPQHVVSGWAGHADQDTTAAYYLQISESEYQRAASEKMTDVAQLVAQPAPSAAKTE